MTYLETQLGPQNLTTGGAGAPRAPLDPHLRIHGFFLQPNWWVPGWPIYFTGQAIGGSKGVPGMHAPLWGSKFFHFHAVFGKNLKNNSNFGSWHTPVGKILDPPLQAVLLTIWKQLILTMSILLSIFSLFPSLFFSFWKDFIMSFLPNYASHSNPLFIVYLRNKVTVFEGSFYVSELIMMCLCLLFERFWYWNPEVRCQVNKDPTATRVKSLSKMWTW